MLLKPIGIQKRTVTAILGTALLAFVIFGLGLALYRNSLMEARVHQFLSPYAEMIAVSATPAADVGDKNRALEILNSLRSNPQILRADIIKPDGGTLATYPASQAALDQSLWSRPDGIYLGNGTAELVRGFSVSDPKPAHVFIRMSLAVMQQRDRQMLLDLSFAVGLILAVVALLQFLLLRRWVLSPLARLATIAETAGKQGDYSQRVPAHERDEFGQLGRSFNLLLASVAERETALRRLSNFQQTILKDAAYAIISTDTKGLVTSFNPAAEWLLGYKAEEVVGSRSAADFHDGGELAASAQELALRVGETPPSNFEIIVAQAQHSLPMESEWNYLRKDGSRVPVLLSVTTLRDEKNQPAGYLCMAVDIQRRKQAVAALQESERRFRELAENINEVFWTFDAVNLRTIYVSPAFDRIWGIRRQVVVEDPAAWGQTIHPDDYDEANRGFQAALAGKPPLNREYRIITGSGGVRWIRDRSFPIFEAKDKVVRLVGVAEDITERKEAEMKLRESVEFNQQLVTASPIGVQVFSADGVSVMVNAAAARIIGTTPEQLASVNFRQIDSWRNSGLLTAAESVLATGESRHLEAHLVTTYGREVWLDCTFSRFYSGGKPHLLHVLSDITDRKLAEQSLLESQRLYEDLVAFVPLGVYRVCARVEGDYYLEYVSDRFCEVTGLTRAAVLADVRQVFGIIHPEERATFDQANAVAFLQRAPFRWEGRAIIGGQTRWLHFESHPTLLPDRLPFWTGVVFDVSERKAVEEALRQNHSLLEGTLQATADGILAVSADGKITSYNRQFVELWRVPREILDAHDLPRLTEYLFRQLHNPASPQAGNRLFNETSKADTFDTLEFADGRVFERFSRPQKVEGRVVGRVWSFRDVTARHWAVASLRESEHKFKTLFETANDAILIMNENGLVDFNRMTETIFGAPREQIINVPTAAFSPERQADGQLSTEKAAEKIRAALAGTPQFFEWIYLRGDGSLFNAEVSLNRLELRGQTVLQAIVRDITARKRAEAARHEAEELYRTLVNTSPDGIAVLDMTGCVQFSSPKTLELFYGTPDAEPQLGRSAVEFVSEVDRARAMELLRGALAGKFPLNERLVMRRSDGHEFVAELNGTLLRDGLGVPHGIMVIIRDVTERQRQEDELKNKNAELERFTYTVSHDLKSPLITIKGFAGALLTDAAAGRTDRLTSDLKRIVVAADKMSELLNGLLALSRIGRIVNPPINVSMTKLADDVLALLAGSIAQRQAKVTVQPGLPDAFGDAQRLQEVLQNLVENALKFSAPGHAPEIEIGFTTIGGQTAYFVRDHGRGIEARFHKSIFGLFNKLDTHTAGTGIGLALVRRIVEFHGGTVWVESAGLGQGATFCFTLAGRKALSVPPAR